MSGPKKSNSGIDQETCASKRPTNVSKCISTLDQAISMPSPRMCFFWTESIQSNLSLERVSHDV